MAFPCRSENIVDSPGRVGVFCAERQGPSLKPNNGASEDGQKEREDKMGLGKCSTLAAALFAAAISLSAPAAANYIFSGSGSSGNFQGQASEPWILNSDTPYDNWGSPGVSAGTTLYLGAEAAFGLDLVFSGVGPIDAQSIITGNAGACVGSSGGGTTFCNDPFGTTGIWQAFKTADNAISFRAQDVSQILDPGESFFVNVFFLLLGDEPASTIEFKGEWITSFSPEPVPVPAALPLLASGLGALGVMGWRRKRKQAQA